MINVLPDYSASLLEYLNGGREEASADAASTAARLGAYLDQFGARASAVSPGAAAMVFAVDAGVARASSLRRLSDLQSVAAVMKVPRVGRAAAAGPPALAVSLRAERHELALGDRGPEVAAVQARLQQLGYPVSMDGALAGATVQALHAFEAARGCPPAAGRSTTVLAGPWSAPPHEPPDRRRNASSTSPTTTAPTPRPRAPFSISWIGTAPGRRSSRWASGREVPRRSAEVARRGNAIGNHTQHHADLKRAGPDKVRAELTAASDAIAKATGRAPSCMRPPYGAIDKRVRAVTTELGVTPVLWSVDTRDWDGPGIDAVVQSAVGGARPGAVILLHDGGNNGAQTVQATGRILAQLSGGRLRLRVATAVLTRVPTSGRANWTGDPLVLLAWCPYISSRDR